jgi:hypothetical protein
VTVFASTTVEALDVEMKALAERILADARTCCPECKGLHLAPFVDINPARIPPREARSRDRVELFLDRQATTVLPTTQLRIACPTPAVAEHTAALLRGLGAPAHAIHLGGTTS